MRVMAKGRSTKLTRRVDVLDNCLWISNRAWDANWKAATAIGGPIQQVKRFELLERLQTHHAVILINRSGVIERLSYMVGAMGQRLREDLGMEEYRERWMCLRRGTGV